MSKSLKSDVNKIPSKLGPEAQTGEHQLFNPEDDKAQRQKFISKLTGLFLRSWQWKRATSLRNYFAVTDAYETNQAIYWARYKGGLTLYSIEQKGHVAWSNRSFSHLADGQNILLCNTSNLIISYSTESPYTHERQCQWSRLMSTVQEKRLTSDTSNIEV